MEGSSSRSGRPPTIQRKRLAAELRLLREATRLTLEGVSARLGWSIAKISRIENGLVGITQADLSRLLDFYGVHGERRAALCSRTRLATARTKGWWDAYAEFLPDDYTDYIELEAQLVGMRCYDAHFVGGLLQTEAYAREVVQALSMGRLAPAEIERRVEVRMRRQQLLTRPARPLRLHAVIAEPALAWLVGSRTTMVEQCQCLLSLAARDNITLQILPAAVGAHPATTSFAILQFPDAHEPDVVHLETMTSNHYVEADADVHRYGAAFDSMAAMALNPSDSLQYLADLAERMARTPVVPSETLTSQGTATVQPS